MDGVVWIVLVVTWAQIKKFNRNTRKVFDKTIRTFPERRFGWQSAA